MDWKKIKTNMIIILLILNGILATLYFYNNYQRQPYLVSDETIEELELRLEKKGINLNTEIPKGRHSLKPLIVRYKEEQPVELNQRFFENFGQVVLEDNITKITNKEEEITIINNRRLLYENFGNIEADGENSKEKALKFLEDRGFKIEDLVLTNVDDIDGFTTYEFTRSFGDILLETSYTRITMFGGRVYTMDRLWIEIIEEDKAAIEMEPAHKALFKLLGREIEDKDIDSIEICYYFNPEEQGLIEDNTRAERGRAIPAWRIGFEDGSSVVIDNY